MRILNRWADSVSQENFNFILNTVLIVLMLGMCVLADSIK